MLLIILALFWVALLAPTVVRRFRDHGAERSIESFHEEHRVLSRQEYAVPPAHRLEQPDQGDLSTESASARRARLTVVHADDTYRSLESRGSWDEWSQDYDYDDDAQRRATTTNRYASAYSSVPNQSTVRQEFETPIRRRSMKAQRKMMFGRLVLSAVLLSVIAYFSGVSLIMDVALVAWLCVVAFVALALYSVSQGYLDESSLPLHLPQRRSMATVQPLYDDYPVSYEGESEYDDQFYEPDSDVRWQRDSQPRRALG